MDSKRINLTNLNKGLITIFLVSLILYFGRVFLIPIAIAAFFAMLLYPVVQKLQRYGLQKSWAGFIAILLLLVALVMLSTLVYYKITDLQADLPELEEKIAEKTARLKWLFYEKTDISENEQNAILEAKTPDIFKAIYKIIKNLMVQGLSLLLAVFIILTYIFFLLIYQHRIHNFFVKIRIFQTQRQSQVMLARIARIAHDYLKGTIIVISVLAVIYALGFWVIGLEHALLFALLTALLRIIPYFGSFLGIAFTIAFTFLVKDSFWYPVLVLAFFMLIQLVEANLLTPYITGSRVKLNPLVTIMAILYGNLVWGAAGMILFIPLFAMLKVICDHVPQLNAFGYILGKEEENA